MNYHIWIYVDIMLIYVGINIQLYQWFLGWTAGCVRDEHLDIVYFCWLFLFWGLDIDMAWYGTCMGILSGLGPIEMARFPCWLLLWFPCWLLLLVPYFLWKEVLPEDPSKTSLSRRWGFLKYEYLFGSSGGRCVWMLLPIPGIPPVWKPWLNWSGHPRLDDTLW